MTELSSHLLEEVRNPKTGEIFIFSSAFSVFRVLERLGQNPNSAFNDLATGDPKPDTVLNVLTSTMIQIKNSDGTFVNVSESEAKEIVEKFIEDFGFMQTSFLAQHMISKLMIGDEKKYKGAIGQKIEYLMMSLSSRSRYRTFFLAGLAWVIMPAISGALVCWIFSN